jgi:RND family efflux transporter MFP subunit
MNAGPHVSVGRSVAVFAAVVLLLVGAGATYLIMRSSMPAKHMGDVPTDTSSGAPSAAPGRAASETPQPPSAGEPTVKDDAPLPDITVSLTQDAIRRAGIVVAPVLRGTVATAIRVPGTVEPNAYREVVVTPLVSGRLTRVSAQLGDQVRRGQTLAQIYSPELAEAQTRYMAARAQLDAHDRELRRTEKLVEIGAASRQELERTHADHTAQMAAVQSARSRLQLLGVPPSALDDLAAGKDLGSTTNVPAPISGVVTERLANVGLNVDPAARLFTIVDLSTVWVVGELYEKDFSRVRVGTEATITTTAYPDLSLKGRIGYIDPQVSPETRTAKLRVEVPNPRTDLRLGMYAEVVVAARDGGLVPVIPRSAVQNVGDRTVVYLVNPNEQERFTEREVRLGQSFGEQVEVVSGVQPGDLIVTEGSFFVRAERERLGLRPPAAGAAVPSAGRPTRSADAGVKTQEARVIVGEQGYEPSTLNLRAGIPARITFVRNTDKTCGTEVVFPSLKIKQALPLGRPVVIEFTPASGGEIRFACGMNMLHGTVNVQ